jgi:hypothetical protein
MVAFTRRSRSRRCDRPKMEAAAILRTTFQAFEDVVVMVSGEGEGCTIREEDVAGSRVMEEA